MKKITIIYQTIPDFSDFVRLCSSANPTNIWVLGDCPKNTLSFFSEASQGILLIVQAKEEIEPNMNFLRHDLLTDKISFSKMITTDEHTNYFPLTRILKPFWESLQEKGE